MEVDPFLRPPYCDLAALLASLRGNRATAHKLAGLFLGMQPRFLQDLERTTANRDLTAFIRTVHDIRSSCGILSAQGCVMLARRLEDPARDQARAMAANPDAPPLVWPEAWLQDSARLQSVLSAMSQELRDFLGTQAG